VARTVAGVALLPAAGLPATRLPATLLAGALLFSTARAEAFCLTTTCNTEMEDCTKDAHGCTSGTPLHWSSLCLYYGIQRAGSARRDVSAGVVADLMEQSFDTWMNADCGSGSPPFVVQSIGEVECDQPEFNCDPHDHNTNTVMFRDEVWHYDPAALALTTLTVDTRDGTILDADMEVNSLGFNFSVGDSNINNDLLSVLTHESGHFLGLDHSDVDGSTMYPGYSSRETTQRSLDQDDIDGICEIYPPDRSITCNIDVPDATDCIGSSECPETQEDHKATKGCSLSRKPSQQGPLALLLSAALALVTLQRRHQRH
jgi:hypothetical protein